MRLGLKPVTEGAPGGSPYGQRAAPAAYNPARHKLEHTDAVTILPLPAAIHRLDIDPALLRAAYGTVMHTALNPSVTVVGDALRVVVRTHTLGVSPSETINFIGSVDDRWALVDVRRVHDAAPGHRNTRSPWRGYEDMRLIEHGGKLMASATVGDRTTDVRPAVAVLDLTDVSVSRARVQPSPRDEKNWMPVVHHGELRFIYSIDPLIVLGYDMGSGVVSPLPGQLALNMSYIRGGSQLIPYEDGYLAVVHEVRRLPRAGPVYAHRFVRFNATLTTVALGKPFRFRHHGIEFCAGLAEWRGAFVLSFGFADREACLAVVDPAVVRGMM